MPTGRIRVSDRPSVLFVIGSLDVGGAETHLSEIVSRLAKRGWTVSIYCLTRTGPLGAMLKQQGVEVVAPSELSRTVAQFMRVTGLRLAVSVIGLAKLARRIKPDIAHFFLPEAYIIGGSVTLATGPWLRVMSRRSLNYYQAKRPWAGRIERWLHARMTAILGNSRQVVEQMREQEGVDPARLGLIYNGVDTERYSSSPLRGEVRATLGIGDDATVFIVVANLIAYKGHRDLFDALGILKTDLSPGWQLLVVGRDDGIGQELEAHAQSLGIAGNLRFLGLRSDVPALLAAADIGLLTSHEEGFSNAVLEAMASGLPMVVTAVGGNAEAVEDGTTGFVTPVRDPRALAEAIRHLAADRALRETMGQAARERCLRHFSVEACVEQYEQLYEGLYAGIQISDLPGLGAYDEALDSHHAPLT